MLAVSKRQAINLRNCCIWLVDSFEFRWYILLFNPLNAELNPICHLLALLGAHLIFHISRIKVKSCKTDFILKVNLK